MRKNLSFIIFAVLILSLLLIISQGKKVPRIPADVIHINSRNNEACIECHGPGKQAPLKDKHPPKTTCLICHKKN